MKNDINSFPLKELGEALKANWADRGVTVSSYSESWGLKKKPWFVEQAVAFFPQNLSVARVGGKNCIKDPLASLVKKDPRALALWSILVDAPPSKYIANMGKDPRFGTFTPNLLAGFKLYEKVPYSSWTEETFARSMSNDLRSILKNLRLYIETNKPTKEQLSAWRAEAIGSGSSIKYSFTTPKDLKDLGRKEIAMLLQIWIASPEIRSNLSILDPRAYDSLPEPISVNQVVKPAEEMPPWMM